jgi:hypothetical protein
MEIGEKLGFGMLPAQNEFVGNPHDFSQRIRIRHNCALKGQAITARPAGEFEHIRIRRIVQGPVPETRKIGMADVRQTGVHLNAAIAELKRPALHIRAGLYRWAVCETARSATFRADCPRRPGKKPSVLQSANHLPDSRQGLFGRNAKMLREGGGNLLLSNAFPDQIPDGLAGRIEHCHPVHAELV